ncbi:hypothetical protein C0Q70_21523 [Pomacea canaliculata]|uniref:Uncharacterized protein n=1 Tax=Pomacea canaliculata TaxID=400727 RepID=A0A2T7NCR4_POMCA|nr:hypothetical protein C0Q70_21523 [Pomacea canaliculata]
MNEKLLCDFCKRAGPHTPHFINSSRYASATCNGGPARLPRQLLAGYEIYERVTKKKRTLAPCPTLPNTCIVVSTQLVAKINAFFLSQPTKLSTSIEICSHLSAATFENQKASFCDCLDGGAKNVRPAQLSRGTDDSSTSDGERAASEAGVRGQVGPSRKCFVIQDFQRGQHEEE